MVGIKSHFSNAIISCFLNDNNNNNRQRGSRDLGGLETLFAARAGTLGENSEKSLPSTITIKSLERAHFFQNLCPRLEDALDRHGARPQKFGVLLRRQLNVHERSLAHAVSPLAINLNRIIHNSASARCRAASPTSSPSTPSRTQLISAPDIPRISSSALTSLSRKLPPRHTLRPSRTNALTHTHASTKRRRRPRGARQPPPGRHPPLRHLAAPCART